MIGQTISHYRIVEKLGGGGMGVVYKAEDVKLGRFVALKFLPDDVAKDPQALSRFQREAKAASALNHPNICTIYEIDDQHGEAFIAMGVSGRADAEAPHRRPTDGNRVDIVARHRDCGCTGCCSLRGHCPPRHQTREPLCDQARTREDSGFWVAKVSTAASSSSNIASLDTQTGSEDAEHLTSPGTMVGTVAYMSPEQVRAKELDARSDLFSFGAVLYAMATGNLPFHGESSAVICEAIMNLKIAGSRQVGSLAVATTITPSCDPTPSRQLSNVWKLTVRSCVRLPSVGKARSRSSRITSAGVFSAAFSNRRRTSALSSSESPRSSVDKPT